jgi:hypothetical protein
MTGEAGWHGMAMKLGCLVLRGFRYGKKRSPKGRLQAR